VIATAAVLMMFPAVVDELVYAALSLTTAMFAVFIFLVIAYRRRMRHAGQPVAQDPSARAQNLNSPGIMVSELPAPGVASPKPVSTFHAPGQEQAADVANFEAVSSSFPPRQPADLTGGP